MKQLNCYNWSKLSNTPMSLDKVRSLFNNILKISEKTHHLGDNFLSYGQERYMFVQNGGCELKYENSDIIKIQKDQFIFIPKGNFFIKVTSQIPLTYIYVWLKDGEKTFFNLE